MRIDDRLDFFRVHFESADVDDSVIAADELIAALAQFDSISRVDKTVLGSQGWGLITHIPAGVTIRADAQSAVFDFQPNRRCRCAEQSGRKAGESIVHLECDTG